MKTYLTSNTNGRKILSVMRGLQMDAVWFYSREGAEMAAGYATAAGLACEPFRLGRRWGLAIV